MFKVLCFIIIALVVRGLRTQGVDIDRLLSEMDESEKCGQMTQLTFDPIQKDKVVDGENPVDLNKLADVLRRYKTGSILNAAANVAQSSQLWQEIIKTIQDYALKEKRKIPILYGLDSIHGANYIREAVLFPQPLSMAATFNLDIAKKVGEITSIETRAAGIPWNFNPVLDIGRQPLWPRLYETYGEDVHLAVKMGEAYIEGHHGPNKDLSKKYSGTCLKHYIGYSYPFNGKDRTPAVIPEITLREYFLPPFAHGVKAGSPTVMVNSGDVNGIPGHANSFYINDILKGELEFDGFVVSDWEDIIRLYTRDKVASSAEESVRISVMAGLDMSMTPYNGSIFFDHCVNLAKKDKEFAKRVNNAARRILKVKKQFGLFENPYPNPDDLKLIGTAQSEEFNLKAASESIILAKNNPNILPLKKNTKVLVTGPASNLLKVLNGGWTYTWQGDIELNYVNFGRNKTTILDEIRKKSNQVWYETGADFDKIINLENVKSAANMVDYVILCIGEPTYTETPGNINNLLISSSQEELANAIFSVGKPVIVVYLGGRPRIMTNIANKAAAVILGFLPGKSRSDIQLEMKC
jgi:beta-glucosidase